MSAVSITPNRVVFSGGLFDSNKSYVQATSNGPILWPKPIVTLGSTQPANSLYILVRYKNGIGGVPAVFSGEIPYAFRGTI